MPAMMITVRAKTKEELKKKVARKLKEAARRGLQYVKQGYSDSRVKKVKGGYEIELWVHS
ncbi:MAG: hypothetical protein KatS3mg078_1336 [Deltaproteobacteria bacterium]|jgi:hypothetical protein|nr:hypothetical protein HRbin37_00601 [bacterium HR37]GIW47459.1 MAG: hypothetical protein KatS3mg078_1336 [Deltaproteobacteria bacterium]